MTNEETGSWVVVQGAANGFAQDVIVGTHRLSADEPTDFGGTDTGPNPYDFLLVALGACTSMTLGLYARRKKWPLESVTVRLRHSKRHEVDCEDCDTKDRLLDHIEREIVVLGPLTDEQRSALLGIANRCPVHKTLTSEIRIESRLA